jgi:hypothetical protein
MHRLQVGKAQQQQQQQHWLDAGQVGRFSAKRIT